MADQNERISGLHATLEWLPYSHSPGDGTKLQGYRREDGAGYVLPDGDRWWVCWAHPLLNGRPGWHHHAFGSYASPQAGVMAFDQVFDLERIAGNKNRCGSFEQSVDAPA